MRERFVWAGEVLVLCSSQIAYLIQMPTCFFKILVVVIYDETMVPWPASYTVASQATTFERYFVW